MSDSRLRGDSPTVAVLRLAQPAVRQFVPGVFFGLVSALSSVGLLATSAWLITRAAEQPPILFLGAAIVGVRAFALLRAASRYVERLCSHDAAFRQLSAVRVGIYRRLVPLAPDGLRGEASGTGRGDLLTRLVNDVDELQNLPLRVIQPLVVTLLTAILSVIGVAIVLPSAGVTLAGALILAFGAATLVQTVIAARAERSIAPLRGELSDRLLDYVSNLDLFVAYDASSQRADAVTHADQRVRLATLAKAGGVGASSAILSALATLACVAALLVGIPALEHGLEGPALAVIALIPLVVFEVVASAPVALGAFRQVRASARRVAKATPASLPVEIPVETPEASSASSARPLVAAQAAHAAASPMLQLRALGARWPGESDPAFSGLDLSIQRGERVVVEGASGSGKTTLAHVLVRFLDYSGSYRIGGVEARELSADAVRSIVGLCEQTPYLFDEDIRQNLLFAHDSATDKELVTVLHRVGLAEWMRERGGLSARVGDDGALVSGGQAQRLALARALLADFPVIVFDEPTANVDPERASGLMRDILSAATDLRGEDSRTVIVISHLPVPDDLVTQRVRLG
ncbi:thiol reductant ABC exporter subunit CydC [Frigoribacterium sp. CG_9.8]|uniref:thiol reductant ABC exporter subunit CydC n=1 Tax=Frigoribacterium sp. CG_9.8 TaxID=2787733 RepID=UPI0018C99604|nr:thiol reductant ABC exporter subunit CydC [Frigoribacterium sp. CG_9.8]MBG6108233.1 ATP-binding cassette subfamily C protein CydC [Frigoribacterium sp. CG_9.8]